MFAPASSEKLIQFWRLFTQPEERSSGNTVVYRLTAEPARRMISLAEPPVLVELARDGEALERAGQTRAALAAFQRARMKAPGLPVLAYGIARCYRSLGEPLKAEKELRRAITMAGPDPILYEALGEILEALKDPRLAALAFEQAAGLDGSSARRWIRAARALKAAGNAPAAAAALSRALAIEPGNPQARALQGKIRS
jgi:tetratricopeptide (TPR) repeat protein